MLVRLTAAVHQGILQNRKITGPDECLARHHQAAFVGDLSRDSADAPDIVGDNLALIAIAPGGCLQNEATLVDHLDGETVQLQHEHDGLLAHK